MKIVLHQSWVELQHLAADWNHLLAESSSDTIFLTWEWCEAWWKAYGSGRSLFVLTAWDNSELVGVAPFYADYKRNWHGSWKRLRIIGDGSGDSDYLDCFTKRGQEQQVLASFMEFLESVPDRWDWIQIEGAPQDSPCLAALIRNATASGWSFASEIIPCAALSLPDNWADYLRMLRPRVRTKVRSALAGIEQTLRITPTECAKPEELDSWLGELYDLHTRRWAEDRRPGVFRNSFRRSFYRELSRSVFAKGWLAFHRLAWAERPLALQYGFRYHNRFYVLQEGYDPAFEVLRPGIALRGWVLRGGIEQGLAEYDFLAGTARHKLDWGAQRKLSRHVLLARKTVAAWRSISFPQISRSLRESAGRLVPATLQSGRKKLLTAHADRGWKDSGQPMPAAKRLVRWSASHLYSDTPLGAISRHFADRYALPSIGRDSASSRPQSTARYAIFKYHRVNDDRDPFFDSLPVSRFRAQMEYLARHFHLISLDQLADGALAPRGPQCCVAITFDDGYRDNFVHAFPILRQMGIPATIFLTTGHIESGRLPWYDQVRLAFKLTVQTRLSLQPFGEADIFLNTEEQRLTALAKTLAWLREIHDADRLTWLPVLFESLRVPGDLNLPSTMLAWEQIRQMNKEGILFGAHTVTHPALKSLPAGRMKDEIFGSKKTIEERLQSPVRHFAYPFGKLADFDSVAKDTVQAAGFQTAVTTVSGVNGSGQDFLELRRLSLDEPDLGIFGMKLDWSRTFARQVA